MFNYHVGSSGSYIIAIISGLFTVFVAVIMIYNTRKILEISQNNNIRNIIIEDRLLSYKKVFEKLKKFSLTYVVVRNREFYEVPKFLETVDLFNTSVDELADLLSFESFSLDRMLGERILLMSHYLMMVGKFWSIKYGQREEDYNRFVDECGVHIKCDISRIIDYIKPLFIKYYNKGVYESSFDSFGSYSGEERVVPPEFYSELWLIKEFSLL